ncbi:MAG: GxxExxY protein [Gemmatimonadaceae bacterium]
MRRRDSVKDLGKDLVQEALARSVIGGFFEVYNRLTFGLFVEIKSTQDLHKAAMRQVYNYLRASNLELRLLLHFGPDPRFYRVYAPNNGKAERKPDP